MSVKWTISCASGCVQAHLQEHSHLGLIQRLDGGLQQLGGVLQVFTMLPPQAPDVVHLLLLLSVDPQNHLALLLLQQGEQVIERLAHLRLLSASILLKQSDTRRPDPNISCPPALLWSPPPLRGNTSLFSG